MSFCSPPPRAAKPLLTSKQQGGTGILDLFRHPYSRAAKTAIALFIIQQFAGESVR